MKKTLILCIALAFLLAGCSVGKKQDGTTNDNKNGFGLFKNKNEISVEDAKTKTIDFINNNLVQPGDKVTIKEATEEDGLYKMTVVMSNGQEINSYISKDGKRFYPQSINISEVEAQNAKTNEKTATNENQPVAATDVPKQDKAKVELFVMSHCPYGTQIEKGFLPVIEALGNKMDFELKFCSYAMHGEKELKEQINQYCIQKNEPAKLAAYLKCFLNEGKGDECITSTKVDKGKLDKCASETDKTYKVMAGFNDKSTWMNGNFPTFNIYKTDNEKYGVGGSPTLVINGKQVSSSRDAKSLLTAVCAGFNDAPEECKKSLSSESPSAGFGFKAAATDSSGGGCGQ